MGFSDFQNKGLFDPNQTKWVGDEPTSHWGQRDWVGPSPLSEYGGFDYLGNKPLTHSHGYDWVGNERVTYDNAGRAYIGNTPVYPWDPSK